MTSDKRKSVIDAAATSFAHFGYKATSMDQIAKIAKVGKGTIYNYFSTKEELLKEIIQNFAAEMRQVATDAITPGNSFVSNFNEALHEVVKFREQQELTIKLSQEVKEFGTPEAVEALQSLENEICDFIESRILLAIERGELRECDPKITAFLMFKMYINLVNDWKERHESLPKEQIASLINLYFIEGLANNNM
ncbi:TetR/AcrR family transcriptional regulator [Texcoconibacillus texcoconensis]|uniref:AcrR family transcriptional regulator n=1 Tax=Texcoconibacillus texcoconensis TaxID=1095777 RepID=A0A840QTQ8_9BACI|nr:TetR/AcrR family transcriptional regulator [Texcoconibacillus texcoconensis]MBB5174730.1 AcrR family transcriptional regulator [Texcoconibacillus texcoconensis]